MTREQATERVLDYAYGEMTPDEAAEFEALLREDPALAAEVAAIREVREAASGLARPELPPAVRGHLLSAARQESHRRAMARRWEYIQKMFLSPVLLGATAIIAALGVGVHLILTQGGADPWTQRDREQRAAVLVAAAPPEAAGTEGGEAVSGPATGGSKAEAAGTATTVASGREPVPAAEKTGKEAPTEAPTVASVRAGVGDLLSKGGAGPAAGDRGRAVAHAAPKGHDWAGALRSMESEALSGVGTAGAPRDREERPAAPVTARGAGGFAQPPPSNTPSGYLDTGKDGEAGGSAGKAQRRTEEPGPREQAEAPRGAEDDAADEQRAAPAPVARKAPARAEPAPEAGARFATPGAASAAAPAEATPAPAAPAPPAPAAAPAAATATGDKTAPDDKAAAAPDHKAAAAPDAAELFREARDLRAAGRLMDALRTCRRALDAHPQGGLLADALAEAAEVAKALDRGPEADLYLRRLERLPGGAERAAAIRAK